VKEIRFYKFSVLRTSGDGRKISGYAAEFKQLSEDLGGFREMVLPGAFDRCLRSGPDVRCLFNHDSNVVLGRTKSGTLRMSTDKNGLRFDCDLPNTQAGRDVRESIGRGDIDQCSFGFVVNGQNWREEKGADGKPQSIRELTDVELFDVSPVTYAAYPQTSVSARLLWPEGEPAEVRSHKKADGPRATKRSPAPVGVSTFRSGPVTWAERQEMQAKLDGVLGIPVSKSKTSGGSSVRQIMTSAEQRELKHFLRTGEFERRDLTTAGPGASFVPESFNAQVFDALKAYDAVFDDDFSSVIESDTGTPLDLFAIDDTESAATIVGEATPDSEQDPGTLAKVQLPQAPSWDSGVVKVSWQLLTDSAPIIADLLAKSFAVRIARGVGANLMSTLTGAAALGVTAAGSAANTGGTETGVTSIGTPDLIALRTSIDPAYRGSGKVGWLMNDNTLAFLDGLLDKQGRPVIKQIYVNGRRMLMGYPVGICPSLPNIGAGNKPILFGALGYFVVRKVKGEGKLIRLTERYAENAETGFKSFLRCNGGLLCATGASLPVKFLQNAAA